MSAVTPLSAVGAKPPMLFAEARANRAALIAFLSTLYLTMRSSIEHRPFSGPTGPRFC